MIWHIFKKDWKLQWRLALAIAFAQLLVSGMLWKPGPMPMVELLASAVMLARAFLIVDTVHHDPLPGVRQDWLVRPIRRSELLAAKCLFTVLVVQLPVFAGDLMEALANGFSFGLSFEAALSRSLYMLIIFSLPILAIASVTKNLLEVLTACVFSLSAIAVAQVLTRNSEEGVQKLAGTPLGWIVGICSALIIVASASAILTMQFRLRSTVPSRWLAAIGGIVLIAILQLPWQQSAFALQSRLSPVSDAAGNVQIAFEANPAPVPLVQQRIGRMGNQTNLLIPLSVLGLPADSILTAEHFELSLIDSQGVIQAKSQSSEYGGDQLVVSRQGTGVPVSLNWRSPAIYNTIPIETSDYVRLKDRRLRLEIDYSLTLMRLAESDAIPAIDGDARFSGVGRCTTHMNKLGAGISLSCLQAGAPSDCYSWFLEHTPSGRRNMENYACNNRNYSPLFAQFFPDAIGRFGNGHIPFHDPTGQAHYAVDVPDIAESQVVIRTFRPLGHFTRQVVTPERPLRDWLAN